MKPTLLSAFFLSVSSLACGSTTEPPVARPAAVAIRDVIASDGTVTITFTQPDSASVQYQAACQSSSGKTTAAGQTSPITITGLTNGVRHSCTVTAVRANASSDPSTAVLVTPGAQLKFASVVLSPLNGSARVSYGLPLEFLHDPLPWFVGVTCNGGGSMHTTASADSVVRDITVTGLQNGVTYSCTLHITSASGSAISDAFDVVPGSPVRPFGPNATPGNASVILSFLPSEDNGSPVTGYTATCGATGQPSRTVTGPSSPLVVTGLANGTVYSCNVYGSNAVGAGEKSASMTVTPGVPTSVNSIVATATSNSITFSFSAPDSDGGSPITSYTVTCSVFAAPPSPLMSSGPASPITLSGLQANSSYNCDILATNAIGNGVRTPISLIVTKP
jgi:hypothetical protein